MTGELIVDLRAMSADVLRVGPDEVLLVRFKGHMAPEERARILETLERKLGAGRAIIVNDPGEQFEFSTVARRST